MFSVEYTEKRLILFTYCWIMLSKFIFKLQHSFPALQSAGFHFLALQNILEAFQNAIQK